LISSICWYNAYGHCFWSWYCHWECTLWFIIYWHIQ
jgi:hypothetical protein